VSRWLRKIPGAVRAEIWSTDHVVVVGMMCFCAGRDPSMFGVSVMGIFGALYALLIGLKARGESLAEQIKEIKARQP